MGATVCRALWILLGHSEDWVQLFGSAQPRRKDRRLYVTADSDGDPDQYESRSDPGDEPEVEERR